MNGRGKILRVGEFETRYVIGTGEAVTSPVFWHFGCENKIPALEIRGGTVLWAGWTLEELREIAARPSEFVEIP